MPKIYTTQAKYMLHGGDYNPDQWLDRPDILADDIRLMKLAHTNTFSVGIFSWSALEPEEGVYTFEWLDDMFESIHRNGGRIILATPSGARPAWLSQKYPEVLRVNAERVKQLHGGRHNHCFTSDVYREKTREINRLLADRYGSHPALLMWHVSNEYGGECHCDQCQHAFRDWLKKRYNHDLKSLNDAWWTPFWSHTFNDWSQIESPSPIGEHAVHGLNLDWRRFVTDQTISFFQNEIVPLKEITPNIPITTNFMADTHDLIPFQGLDYSRFAKHLDVISWDAYPAWHNDWESTADLAMKVGFINDLYRSLKQQPFLLMESTPSAVNWHDFNKAKRPGMHLLSSVQMIAHGSDSILYFQWRKSRGSSEKFHGAVVGHDNSTENRVFQEVVKVGQTLEQLSEVVGTNRPADTAILFDWENHWALADAQGFGLKTKRYMQTLHEHYRPFWERDIPVDVITKEQDFSSYRLLIAPMLYLASEETIARLKAFVANGGTLVMTYISGLVNEHDLTYLGGWHPDLKEIFGIEPMETDTLYPGDKNAVAYRNQSYELRDYATVLKINAAVAEGFYQDDFYANSPAVTSHRYQEGKTHYIGARLNDQFHRDFYQSLMEELSLKPAFPVNHGKGVSVQVRQNDEHDYIFVMNFTEKRQPVTFSSSVTDMLTGELITGDVTLDKYETRIAVNRKNM
ncbi:MULTISPECIES: beta-galactosidase [unclassified Bacillus (in: firmicutes)]|uniref:beta-galactosidase n=1 Tax=unclassified Bacillus (in: firmicutes) TaxID=185979 RepID=UPI00040D80C3|nr:MULTISPECIES: beta-galactosidase [unclassified Bacillus (in: firmicutes)]QHZ44976.1 beta-galactosidase [Bacillus sp. NSP9.1]WFA05225.1 beta-galactosidase [Bacillus sp. HSf4]